MHYNKIFDAILNAIFILCWQANYVFVFYLAVDSHKI